MGELQIRRNIRSLVSNNTWHGQVPRARNLPSQPQSTEPIPCQRFLHFATPCYDKNVTTSEITTHYFLAGKEIAFRKGTTLEYLHTDSLGSTSVTTNSSGAQVGKVAYFPFGGVRSTIGALDTKKLFTGQRLDDTGLYFYNARYYDATIGRFISPDSTIPNPANPQSLNRYSYCSNNPLRYTDPSGHVVASPKPARPKVIVDPPPGNRLLGPSMISSNPRKSTTPSGGTGPSMVPSNPGRTTTTVQVPMAPLPTLVTTSSPFVTPQPLPTFQPMTYQDLAQQQMQKNSGFITAATGDQGVTPQQAQNNAALRTYVSETAPLDATLEGIHSLTPQATNLGVVVWRILEIAYGGGPWVSPPPGDLGDYLGPEYETHEY